MSGVSQKSLSLPVSEAKRLTIFCDFDGTITQVDTLKLMLEKYIPEKWKSIEARMLSGELLERDALVEAFTHFPVSWSQIRMDLRTLIKVDPSFKAFSDYVKERGWDLIILSGGFERFIDEIFKNAKLESLPRIANQVTWTHKGSEVSMASVPRLCDICSHCKSWSLKNSMVQNPYGEIAYIGDGFTDICAIQLADFVFAKGYLENYCQKNEIDYLPFENFSEISRALASRFPLESVFVA